ncbi:hypothetical protein [Halopiger goleimassiliensis]|uniref:hypothetical protein n=1 Tax=Halopiger goleimassiliensis TaxID=1293048 RepID=UPI0012B5F2D6|nr:hypothetical protein [Halopiger goleimassiliensis]
MSSWNQSLSDKWKMMRKEEQYKEEAYLRRKARRDSEEYKPPKIRRAEEKSKKKRAKLHEWARARHQYRRDPESYREEHGPVEGVRTLSMTDNGVEDTTGIWIPFEGSRGGRGWKHTGTGEKKYQLVRPGSDCGLDEPPDIESRWRDPSELSADNPDFEAPLSPDEAREFFDTVD